jgi:hypothetical protein
MTIRSFTFPILKFLQWNQNENQILKMKKEIERAGKQRLKY